MINQISGKLRSLETIIHKNKRSLILEISKFQTLSNSRVKKKGRVFLCTVRATIQYFVTLIGLLNVFAENRISFDTAKYDISYFDRIKRLTAKNITDCSSGELLIKHTVLGLVYSIMNIGADDSELIYYRLEKRLPLSISISDSTNIKILTLLRKAREHQTNNPERSRLCFIALNNLPIRSEKVILCIVLTQLLEAQEWENALILGVRYKIKSNDLKSEKICRIIVDILFQITQRLNATPLRPDKKYAWMRLFNKVIKLFKKGLFSHLN